MCRNTVIISHCITESLALGPITATFRWVFRGRMLFLFCKSTNDSRAIRKANCLMFLTIQHRGRNFRPSRCSSISPSSKRAVNKRFNEISISFSSIKPAFTASASDAYSLHIQGLYPPAQHQPKRVPCPDESHAFRSIEIGNRSTVRDYNAFVSPFIPAIFASTGDYCHNKALLKTIIGTHHFLYMRFLYQIFKAGR